MKHELPAIVPKIVVTFDKPTGGYWDGGQKSGGTFFPTPQSDGTIKWGSWGLNTWFRVGFGRSWKQAVSFAKNKIKRSCRIPCKVEIIFE